MQTRGPGMSRRRLLQAGLLGVAGLTLPEVLRLQALSAGSGDLPRDTAVIYVLQEGGASQLETWDPKPEADSTTRGEFGAVATSVPGVRFSEVLPRQAQIMHRLTVLRSVYHPSTQHSSSVHLIKTGYYCRPESEVNEMPSIGSSVARVRGAGRPGVPAYATINRGARYGLAHHHGPGFDPFQVTNEGDELHHTGFKRPRFSLVEGLTPERIKDRRALAASFDQMRRELDRTETVLAMDAFERQAHDMVTGPAARRAFDLEAEPTRLRERYGNNRVGQSLLLARRLVENGIRFVSVGTFNWDHHVNLWKDMRRDVPSFDQAVATLIEDLYVRGLQRRVLVVVMGEFGRTPRFEYIGRNGPGRDHWGAAMSVLMAGGGLPAGHVVGATNARGEHPIRTPIRLERVLATMYRHLGIDPALKFEDRTGRPRHLLEIRDPIPELS